MRLVQPTEHAYRRQGTMAYSSAAPNTIKHHAHYKHQRCEDVFLAPADLWIVHIIEFT
jgi:hypothetical protein